MNRSPIELPDPSLVLLAGPPSSGRAAVAEGWFRPEERLAAGPADPPGAVPALAEERLAERRLALVELADPSKEGRAALLEVARRRHLPAVALVVDAPRRAEPLARSLEKEKVVRAAWALSPGEAEEVRVRRVPLPCDRRHEGGPFDVIGDLHGCLEELVGLLERLGYPRTDGGFGRHPEGRRAVFVGDLADRGPANAAALRLAMDLVEGGVALCVRGNHDDKLRRALEGRKVQVSAGLRRTLDDLEALPEAERETFRQRLHAFLDGLPHHLVLDGGRLVVAHGGLREDLIGRDSPRVRDFALYGDPTGERDAAGHPVRRDWAAEYAGPAHVVYGHTPAPEPVWRRRTANVDQGCCFGGALTAARWPERTFVSVPARRTYWPR